MQESILDTNTLPEPIYRLINSEKFAVREMDNGVFLSPVKELPNTSDILFQSISVEKRLELHAELMAEIEKGERSGAEKGWLTEEEVMSSLGMSDA